MAGRRAVLLWFLILILPGVWANPQTFDLPPLPRPEHYGNVLIDSANESELEAVGFSHWLHRTRYTCRVCHFEIGFAMLANETGITEAANRAGEYCGTCHDGTIAFAYTDENCERCHSGDANSSHRRFVEFRKFPKAPFGNEIDWTQAVRDGLIEPLQSLEEGFEPLPFERSLELWANWSGISPAVFPHDAHQIWHDCAECHPAPFNVKKKTTEHFEMRYILQGKFCGYCHLNVAFPIDDCWRCHPAMRRR